MSTFDIQPHWGSHLPVLESALAALPPGAVVIEHGAGLYSSPVIARHDVEVICIEEAPGWRQWAAWLYAQAGRKVQMLDRAKQAAPYLAASGVVFVDGATRERCDLIKWALAAKSSLVVAHDTEEDAGPIYNYHRHLFSAGEYHVSHDSNRPRTTTWKRAAPPL